MTNNDYNILSNIGV